jgi:hypothetical protein
MKISTVNFNENVTTSLQPDKFVRRLDDFPELVQALRDGDQLAARLLFSQLFDGEDWNEVLTSGSS